ncbi:MAG: hypothetical protein ACI4M6_06740 [Christensenellaceae bacterium]
MKKLKKYLIIPVICFMLAVLFAPNELTSAWAYSEEDFSFNSNGYLSFTIENYDVNDSSLISEQTVLKSGNASYTFHYLPFGVRRSHYTSYRYAEYVTCMSSTGFEYYGLVSTQKYTDVICVEKNRSPVGYFSNEQGEAEVRAFFDGAKASYVLCNGLYAPCSDEIGYQIDEFYATRPTAETFELSFLYNCEKFDLLKCDSTYLFEKNYIKFFEIDGNIYALWLDELENGYFDAEGNLSYRQGSVGLYKVDGSSTLHATLSDVVYVPSTSEYEISISQGVNNDYADGFIIFCKCLVWFIYILLGIILPIGVAIFAIVKLANLDKSAFKYGDKKRCWVTIIIASSVLIALTLLVMLIMVLP